MEDFMKDALAAMQKDHPDLFEDVEETPDDIEEEEEEEVLEPNEDEDEQEEESDEKPKEKTLDGDETFVATQREKANHAFEELRKKNKELSTREQELAVLAKQLGYDDTATMLEQIRKTVYEREAKQKNIDPTVYSELQEIKRDLEKERNLRKEAENNARFQRFSSVLETFKTDLKLNQAELNNILNAMETDGYTLETLVNLKNPRKTLEGYAKEKVVQTAEQEAIKRGKTKKELEEQRIGKTPGTSEKPNIDKLAAFLISLQEK